jgi:hypothetical protein
MEVRKKKRKTIVVLTAERRVLSSISSRIKKGNSKKIQNVEFFVYSKKMLFVNTTKRSVEKCIRGEIRRDAFFMELSSPTLKRIGIIICNVAKKITSFFNTHKYDCL